MLLLGFKSTCKMGVSLKKVINSKLKHNIALCMAKCYSTFWFIIQFCFGVANSLGKNDDMGCYQENHYILYRSQQIWEGGIRLY